MSTRSGLGKAAQLLADAYHNWDYILEDRPYNEQDVRSLAEKRLESSKEITRPLNFISPSSVYSTSQNRIKTASNNPKAKKSLNKAVKELDFEHLGYHASETAYKFENVEAAENVKEIAEEISLDPTIRHNLLDNACTGFYEEEPYSREGNEVKIETHKPRYRDALDTASEILHDERYTV